MPTTLKASGLALNCTMCIMVDPDTGTTLRDFASSSVTSTMTVDAGITFASGSWDGLTRSYAQLAASNYIAFGANKPAIKSTVASPELTVVAIMEVAGGAARVFGKSTTQYFASQDLAATAFFPTIRTTAALASGAGALPTAGSKQIFGFSVVRNTSTVAYRALHNAASMTKDTGLATFPNGGVDLDWALDYIGRRTDSSTQQNDKIYAVLAFDKALSEAEWDTLRDDWQGVLLDVAGPASTLGGDVTLDNTATSGGLVSVSNSLTGNVTLDDTAPAGTLGAVPGTFTSEALKDWTGTVQAGVALTWFRLYNPSTGALVVEKTGLSTNGSGVVSFSDSAITAATSYAADWLTATGARRMPIKAAA